MMWGCMCGSGRVQGDGAEMEKEGREKSRLGETGEKTVAVGQRTMSRRQLGRATGPGRLNEEWEEVICGESNGAGRAQGVGRGVKGTADAQV